MTLESSLNLFLTESWTFIPDTCKALKLISPNYVTNIGCEKFINFLHPFKFVVRRALMYGFKQEILVWHLGFITDKLFQVNKEVLLIGRFVTFLVSSIGLHISCKTKYKFVIRNRSEFFIRARLLRSWKKIDYRKNKEIFYERGKLYKEKVMSSERKQQIKKVWRSGRK